MKVTGRWSVKRVDVRADGTGLSSRAGTALLALVADRVGSTAGLCDALEGTRERRGGHEPGRVFCDLAVMLADGGRCVSDLGALAGQESLFGEVASVSTARRVMLSIGEVELAGIRAARAAARARAWKLGAAPERVISISMRPRSTCIPRRSRRPGITRAGSGLTRCWSRAAAKCWAGSSDPGTPARTMPRITSRCWTWRLSSCRRARWTVRSSRGLIRRAPATSSPTPAARPGHATGERRDARRGQRPPTMPESLLAGSSFGLSGVLGRGRSRVRR